MIVYRFAPIRMGMNKQIYTVVLLSRQLAPNATLSWTGQEEKNSEPKHLSG